MNYQDNFIAEYPDIFNQEYCSAVIDYFKFQKECQRTFGRPKGSGIRMDDESTVLSAHHITDVQAKRAENTDLIDIFNDIFWSSCYVDYANKYQVLNNMEEHTIRTFKIQRTLPSQGYHVWHSENGQEDHSTRILAYTVFLNNVEEGGETEFLYQSRRVKPEMGKVLLFPAYFTHAHRGNPPLSGEKYIMTGWIEFT